MLGVELVNDLVKEGRIALTQPVERVVTYHDPCRLNKRKGVHEAPRELLRAVPGIEFRDVDHVTQWSYCSGGGGGLPIEKPEITEEISRRRVARAQALEVDTLVSACPWSERPLSRGGRRRATEPLEVLDLFELVAQSAGIEVGGQTHAARGGAGMSRRASRARSTTRVIEELRAIIGDDDRVLAEHSARASTARACRRRSRCTAGRSHMPDVVVLPRTAAGGLRGRQARQPPADPGRPARRRDRALRRRRRRCAAASRSTSSS